MKKRSGAKIVLIGVMALCVAAVIFAVFRRKAPLYLAEADLGDGRIIRVEDITFGRKHQVGNESLVIQAIGPWLPMKAQAFFQPEIPMNKLERDENVLVIWVNAVSSAYGTNVDCQGIKLTLTDETGNDLW